VLENNFLGHGQPFLVGEKLSMADIHVAWAVQATFDSLDILQLPGFDKKSFPKTQAWIQRLPVPQPKTIAGSEAIATITSAEYIGGDFGFDESDPLQLRKGDTVAIEMSDDLGRSGRLPQLGALEGLNGTEVVIGLENGIRVHFPRTGIVIRKID
jgi:hypothetical protein